MDKNVLSRFRAFLTHLKEGVSCPVLMKYFRRIEKMAHFNRTEIISGLNTFTDFWWAQIVEIGPAILTPEVLYFTENHNTEADAIEDAKEWLTEEQWRLQMENETED